MTGDPDSNASVPPYAVVDIGERYFSALALSLLTSLQMRQVANYLQQRRASFPMDPMLYTPCTTKRQLN
jgi:hypothetical protein